MPNNFPGQPPSAQVTTKYPTTQYPTMAQVVGDVATTDASSAAALDYLLTQQAELLMQLLVQMKITNYYLQVISALPDEPADLANELLTQRGN